MSGPTDSHLHGDTLRQLVAVGEHISQYIPQVYRRNRSCGAETMIIFSLLDALIAFLRPAFFVLGLVAAIFFALDWALRTKRINPLGPLAQFLRKYVDPIIAPVERKIVRAGGLPSSAPWWTLAAVVVGGILTLSALQFLRTQLAMLYHSAGQGPRGVAQLLIYWGIAIMQLALLIRVLSSWVGLSTWSRWLRWTVLLTEPILRPLRSIIPSIGMIDITPIVAWLLLALTRSALLSIF